MIILLVSRGQSESTASCNGLLFICHVFGAGIMNHKYAILVLLGDVGGDNFYILMLLFMPCFFTIVLILLFI